MITVMTPKPAMPNLLRPAPVLPASAYPLLTAAIVLVACEPPLACGELLVEDAHRRVCVCPNGGVYRDGLCYLDGSASPLDGMTIDGGADATDDCSPEACNGVDDDCDGVRDNDEAASSCDSAPRVRGASCPDGECVVASCVDGYDDCNDRYEDGCEAELATIEHCSSCGDACAWECSESQCNDPTVLAVGENHALVVRSDGTVAGWGNGRDGVLADTEVTDNSVRPVPRPVVSPYIARVEQLATGGGHTCALHRDRTVSCWGANYRGQLGYETTEDRSVPQFLTLAGVTHIAAGGNHNCAILDTGEARCWGDNRRGQVGNAASTMFTGPVPVLDLPDVPTKIAAGRAHTCAALRNGRVVCWGANDEGQLGVGPSTSSSVRPVDVGLSGIASVSSGEYHTCALARDGSVYCWGNNRRGQVGNGSILPDNATPPVFSPHRVEAVNAASLALGGEFTCALTSNGLTWCWGANETGQIGQGAYSNEPILTPSVVVGLSDVVQIGAGDRHACALLADHRVMCWGDGGAGEIGRGAFGPVYLPAEVLAPL